MKLSKQERIGILVVAVILILGLGIWLFIVPKIDALNKSGVTYDTKQKELAAAQATASLREGLKDDVLKAYEDGQDLADMFFEELTTYEADMEFKKFLDQCDANVMVESVSISKPATYTLAPVFYNSENVTYDLKTYVTQGLEKTEEEIKAEEHLNKLKTTLGNSQTVGAITVSFTVNAVDPQDLIDFADEVNEYIVDANGKSTRMAIMLNGFSQSYPLVVDKYKDDITEIEEQAAEDALDELYKFLNEKRPADETTNTNTDNDKDDKQLRNPSDYYYSLDTSVTFLSVERMQDPTEQLEAQDEQ